MSHGMSHDLAKLPEILNITMKQVMSLQKVTVTSWSAYKQFHVEYCRCVEGLRNWGDPMDAHQGFFIWKASPFFLNSSLWTCNTLTIPRLLQATDLHVHCLKNWLARGRRHTKCKLCNCVFMVVRSFHPLLKSICIQYQPLVHLVPVGLW